MDLGGAYIARLRRDGEDLTPLEPDTELRAGDVLTLVGGLTQLSAVTRLSGLAPTEGANPGLEDSGPAVPVEAVVGQASPLVGRTPRQVSFRERYDAVIVAVHRSGHRVEGGLAASSSFLTPIGDQTNTIVYAVGGYRYGDYWRLGAPVLAVVLAVALLAFPLVWEV